MTGKDMQLFDMGLRLYHPTIFLENRKYVVLVEQLCEIFPAARKETDAFEFSLSQAQTVNVTPSMITISDIFGNDVRGTTRRVFHVLGRILDVMEVDRIEAFDHAVSARLHPTGDAARGSFEDFPADLFIEKSFLKGVDFSHLGAEDQKPVPSVNWVFDRGERGISLKIGPFPDDRDDLFIEISVQHPEGNISLGDIRASVEEDIRYLREDVMRFLHPAKEPGKP